MAKEVSLHDLFGDFYLGLVKKNIPRTVAISLTAELMNAMLAMNCQNDLVSPDELIKKILTNYLKGR